MRAAQVWAVLAAVPTALGVGACGGGAASTTVTVAPTARAEAPRDVVGVTSREEIADALPAWRDAIAAAVPDDELSRALAGVPPGAEIDVFLGTWCGDSRREVSRLFVALALAQTVGPLPFTVRFVGVDRAKEAPGLTEDVDLRYVPTIIVRRDGAEVGRIVEHPPRPVEQELLDLLTGARTGWISLTRMP